MNEADPGSLLNGVKGVIFPAARLLGLAFFFTTLLSYRSYLHRPVFGRWSYPFLVVVLISAGLVLGALVRAARAIRGRLCSTRTTKLIDLSILLWGVAYLLAARADPTEAGRVGILNFFGSCSTSAAFLEWLVLVLLFFAVLPLLVLSHEKWKRLGLTVASILFLFVALEGFLRLKSAFAPVDEGYPTCSSLQWKRRYEHINREGWRDAEHSLLPTPGTRRLLVVGDSIALGWGVPNARDRLGEQVAERLQDDTGELWEPINASLGGADTLDEIDYLKKTISYRPDVVLLIYSFNDIDYLAPQIAPTTLPARARYYPQWLLYSNFYVFQEIMLRARLIYYRFFAREAPSSQVDPYMDQDLLSRHLQDVVRFVKLASENGATVRVVPFEMDPDPQFRARYRFFVPQATAAGVPICSLEHAFDGYKLPQLSVSVLDGHPNELAHSLAADSITRCLSPLISALKR
jgi:lysophospholipase L1-like esterase